MKRYVDAHPNAADTLSGIAKWWLARPRFDDDVDLLAALEMLVEQGVLERQPLTSGGDLFRSARRRALI